MQIERLVLHSSTWHHLTVCKQTDSGAIKNITLRIISMYKYDLALNNDAGLMCHYFK